MKKFSNQHNFNERRFAAALNRYSSLDKPTKAKIIKKSFKKTIIKKTIIKKTIIIKKTFKKNSFKKQLKNASEGLLRLKTMC